MIDLDDLGALARIDQSGLLVAIEGFPKQCAQAVELEEEPPLSPGLGLKRLIITGMGGSGIAGELLAGLVELPVSVHHGYGLSAVDRETLVIAISYSGDTEETLSSVEQALQAEAKLLCLSSGGELERLARERNLPFIKVPSGLQPRAALGYLLLPLLSLLDRLVCCQLQLRAELEHLPESLSELRGRWRASNPEEGNRAKRLARGLYQKIPLIYGVEQTTEAVALRWKTQINENSKQPAFWNVVPELCHNEIVGFEAAGLTANLRVLFLRSGHDHPRNRARIELLKELLAARRVEHEEVQAEGEGRLIQLFSLIYLGDFVSFYLAMLNEVDPSPVPPIAELKRRLGRRPWSPGDRSSLDP